MNKMNNKGFAISTIIYGLSIMGILTVSILMGIMSTTRSNNRKLSKEIEQELVSYGKTSVTLTDTQPYIVSETGYYRIELWGASNGNGLGAYTSGIIKLNAGTTINIAMVSEGTEMWAGGKVIMRAARGEKVNIPGGTLCKPSAVSTGGKITFTKENVTLEGNLIGSENIQCELGQNSTEKDSIIQGYAGSSQGMYNYFVNGIMLPGVNNGSGKVKIEKIGTELVRKNKKLDRVSEIQDCVEGPTPSKVNIEAMKGGKSLSAGIIYTEPSKKCTTYTLGAVTDLDEIAIWHGSGKDYQNHTIRIIHTNGTIDIIKGIGGNKISETETATGYRISAYQPDYTVAPENGNYYIMPVLSENKVLTATQESKDTELVAPLDKITNITKIDYLKGSKEQIWAIEKYGDAYKIIESSNFNSLTVSLFENKIDNLITTESKFDEISPKKFQLWDIVPVGDGTFLIKSKDNGKNSDGTIETGVTRPEGIICPQTNTVSDSKHEYGRLYIAPNNSTVVARFKLIKLDF